MSPVRSVSCATSCEVVTRTVRLPSELVAIDSTLPDVGGFPSSRRSARVNQPHPPPTSTTAAASAGHRHHAPPLRRPVLASPCRTGPPPVARESAPEGYRRPEPSKRRPPHPLATTVRQPAHAPEAEPYGPGSVTVT